MSILLQSAVPFKPWEQKVVVRDDPDYVAWFARYGESWEAQNKVCSISTFAKFIAFLQLLMKSI